MAELTHWELVRQLHERGVARASMVAQLRERGLSEEDALVLINSISGALPPALPTPELAPGGEQLAWSLLTLSIGGPPKAVATFWIGLGAAILVALGVGAVVTETGHVKLPENVAYYALRVGAVASFACVVRGVLTLVTRVQIRRRP